ncbi:cysteine proteinase [Panus rudis PR-1116 ss-1]|nr:cysteine proteinase [Panus rudis PR-1116 ss-1]
MHSSISSPKRSASQDLVQENAANDIYKKALDINAEIDAYMAEQGVDDAFQPLETHQSADTPTLNGVKKLDTIDALQKSPMAIGQTWYLVARQWYRRFQKACSGEEDKEGRIDEKDLGPVDNSPLVDSRGNLVSSTVEHVDVEFVPEEAWSLFVQWYGTPQYPLPRKVIPRGIMEEPSLELHPPRLKVHLLSDGIVNDQQDAVPLTISTKDSLKSLNDAILKAVEKPGANTRRVWRLTEGGSWTKLHYPSSRLKSDGASPLESDSTKTVEEAMIESGDTFVVEEAKSDGSWLIEGMPKSAVVSGTSTPIETTSAPPKLFGEGPDYFTTLQSKVASVKDKYEKASTLKPPVTIKLGPQNRPKGSKIAPGTLGLGNMGNTCFMNSAIQCLAHTQELTEYFLTGVYEEELNPDNPLGMQGAIANAFGALLRRIWDPNSSSTSYSPREFKSVLQRYAPQFAGYQQHDSQELVAFLLDGLHEDLNRILQKPYIEKPDWEGGGDKELVQLAKTSWEGYLKRNDSVIVDLFQGQYQSTLVCPECEKVSITFDPFMYLTLPLPIQKKRAHRVFFIPWDKKAPHVVIPLELSRDASFRDVRQQIGRWTNTNPDNLVTMEIYAHRFFKELDDNCPWGDVAENDVVACYELPCQSPQSRPHNKKKDNDWVIVPVLLCDTYRTRSGYSTNSVSVFGYPFILALTEEQANDPDAIYDMIIGHLERWSVNPHDLYKLEAGPPESPMEEVQIPISVQPTTETVTEIKENGDVVTVEEAIPEEEGDIVDEKRIVQEEQDEEMADATEPNVLRRVGTKKDIFNLLLHPSSSNFGSGSIAHYNFNRFVPWEQRQEQVKLTRQRTLVRTGDALYCEFDENLKTYYFGDTRDALWDKWEEFIHPEYTASREAAAARKNKTITLQDCLDEFTREEKLGEDDLWYCPRCKKHQQATKRFDLWKAPDVLVVHLKRFSNTRSLRDKIDASVDFPLEGLDLTEMIGERKTAKRLSEQGVDVSEFGIHDVDEPLVYDLYAVDEHLGGLGGGHYRAYAYNHVTGAWYHFDDSYVSQAKPEEAVNQNAYLLFYRRRTSHPLGGKSWEKIEEFRNKPRLETTDSRVKVSTQLPTPPSEAKSLLDPDELISSATPLSLPSFSPGSSPPPLDDGDPPAFEEALDDPVIQSSLGQLTDLPITVNPDFDFPDPGSRASPSSSVEAEADPDGLDPLTPDSLDREGSPIDPARLRAGLEDFEDVPDLEDSPFVGMSFDEYMNPHRSQPNHSKGLNDPIRLGVDRQDSPPTPMVYRKHPEDVDFRSLKKHLKSGMSPEEALIQDLIDKGHPPEEVHAAMQMLDASAILNEPEFVKGAAQFRDHVADDPSLLVSSDLVQ